MIQPLCLLIAVSLLSVGLHATSAQVVVLPPIPPHAPPTSQLLDPRLASFSIEFSYLPSFGGNKSNPNILSQELIQRLVERTGVGPDIRPGGITVDSAVFSPNSPALVLDESPTGGIYKTTFGPAYYESLGIFPDSSLVVVDVNLGNNTVSFARDEIAAAIQYIGWDRIRALELGNEADHYPGGLRPSGWTETDYTAQFLNWTEILTANLTLPSHIFQAGGFADSWSTQGIIDEGIDTTGVVKLFCQHTYQYSTCDPSRNAIATLPNLIDHGNITAFLDQWKPQVAAAHSRGKEFVVGEYNSVSCSGKENVTNTFGQALWLADTVLYGSSIGISRMYLHQGATLVFQSNQQSNAPGFSWYDLWYPVPTDRYGPARASPSFVAYLLITEAIGTSQQSRISILPSISSQPQFAAYAIWDKTLRSSGPAKLAILNLATRNVTSTQTEKDNVAIEVDLSEYIQKGRMGRVKRMTALGLDSTDSASATWAGQSFENGVASGAENVENLVDGKVTIQGSEAVLVFF
ncbi:glycoside hydrolase superfamily [Abortiporus biennis]|nr:glycoside hydrolase superfamily [Abortiporus biennis]